MSKNKVYYGVWPNPCLQCKLSCRENKNINEKPTTSFFSGKMLIFAKTSLESFANDFTEIFFFPNKKTREIYNKYMIERVFLYSVLTDTDSICIFFIFICKLESYLSNSKFKDVLFEVIVENEILTHLTNSGKTAPPGINLSRKNLVISA